MPSPHLLLASGLLTEFTNAALVEALNVTLELPLDHHTYPFHILAESAAMNPQGNWTGAGPLLSIDFGAGAFDYDADVW